jgi:hypothetical protein
MKSVEGMAMATLMVPLARFEVVEILSLIVPRCALVLVATLTAQ